MPRNQKQSTRRPATKFPHLAKKLQQAKARQAGSRKPTGKKK
jgi:hypothetical protein